MKPRKQRMEKSGPVPPLRQLKLRPFAERDWAYGLSKQMSSEAARGEIREKLGISLESDTSYGQFLSWQFHQQRLENYNQMLEQFENFYRKAKPGVSSEKVREAGIAFFMTEGLANNDIGSFADAAKLSMKENKGRLEIEKFNLDKEKVQISRKKLQEDQIKQFLIWFKDQKARDIAESGVSNAEKIQQMRQTYFADVDEMEKSGQVQIPK